MFNICHSFTSFIFQVITQTQTLYILLLLYIHVWFITRWAPNYVLHLFVSQSTDRNINWQLQNHIKLVSFILYHCITSFPAFDQKCTSVHVLISYTRVLGVTGYTYSRLIKGLIFSYFCRNKYCLFRKYKLFQKKYIFTWTFLGIYRDLILKNDVSETYSGQKSWYQGGNGGLA